MNIKILIALVILLIIYFLYKKKEKFESISGLSSGITAVGIDAVTGQRILFKPGSVDSGFTVGEAVIKAKNYLSDESIKAKNYFNKEGDNRENFDMHGIRPLNVEWDAQLTGLDVNYEDTATHGVSNRPSMDFSTGLPSYMDPDQIDSVMAPEGDDPDFWNGRGKLGSCRGQTMRTSKYRENVAYLGTKNDDMFDGERAIKLGTVRRDCHIPRTSVKQMQQNMLDKRPCNYEMPQKEPRTFLGTQGYIYKEPGMA